MDKHFAGPYRVIEGPAAGQLVMSLADGPIAICAISSLSGMPEQAAAIAEVANANRIALCLTACEGISTEHLLRYTKAGFPLDQTLETSSSRKLAEALTQRDQLLAALIKLREDAVDACADSSIHKAYEIADAAIANAKGGAE